LLPVFRGVSVAAGGLFQPAVFAEWVAADQALKAVSGRNRAVAAQPVV
jgi:hypothetical protein